jgi:hypothetical protein
MSISAAKFDVSFTHYLAKLKAKVDKSSTFATQFNFLSATRKMNPDHATDPLLDVRDELGKHP